MAHSSDPYFSVVIPTYNRASSIRPTLESVQRQTFADFECLVIDDGSRDGKELEAVVNSFGDRRFQYVRQNNGGASSARNNGFLRARGEYIALLDSDDLFVPDKLEKHAEVIQTTPGDVLTYSSMFVERGLEKAWIRPARGLRPGERVDEYLLCTSGTIRTSTVVVKASLARTLLFDVGLPSLQDTDFAIRVANAGASIKFIDEPLVVFNDQVGAVRVSRNADYLPLLAWLDKMKGQELSERAYWAGRGWQCARIASYTDRKYAVGLYLQALVRGVFPFRQALVVAAQVVVPYGAYQKIANGVVMLFGRRQR